MIKFLQKAKWGYLALSVALLALGICNVIWPELAAKYLCYAIGAVALILGVIELTVFFIRDIAEQRVSINFILGFLASAFGIILLVKPNDGQAYFAIIIGVIILVDSVLKLQTSFDLRIVGDRFWWISLILAFASAVLGILLVVNPFEAATALMIFMGISLIVDALLNIWTVIYTSIIIKKLNKLSGGEIVVVENEK